MRNTNSMLLETVAAVSGDLHSDKLYADFYKGICDKLMGFPGIWHYCVCIASRLNRWENKNGGSFHAYDTLGIEFVDMLEALIQSILRDGALGAVASDRELDDLIVRIAYSLRKDADINGAIQCLRKRKSPRKRSSKPANTSNSRNTGNSSTKRKRKPRN